MELLWSPTATEEFQKNKHHREDGEAHLSRILELDIQEYQPNCDLQNFRRFICIVNQSMVFDLDPPPSKFKVNNWPQDAFYLGHIGKKKKKNVTRRRAVDSYHKMLTKGYIPRVHTYTAAKISKLTYSTTRHKYISWL